jgi:hypothetical protein
MITMDYISSNNKPQSINVIDLHSLYHKKALFRDGSDCVIFGIKSDHNYNILYTNSKFYPENTQYIHINKTVFNIKEIMENPDRIYSLMQQELLRDSIDNLP